MVMIGMRNIAAVLLVAGTGLAYAGVNDMLDSAEKMLGQGDHQGAQQSAAHGTTANLSDGEIGGGLKQALSIGAERAVALLGKSGGFLDDPQVRIPLPGALEKAGKVLRTVGKGALVDEFETTVNRAAEQAIPQTLDIVKRTVSGMTLEDVRGILTGGDDAATQFLRREAGDELQRAILPIVSSATDQAGATAAYKKLAGQASSSTGGLVSAESVDLDRYVTSKTLDGLFTKLAAEEKAIRQNPAARSTDLLKKVFGN
jgi:hypothetical protein